MRYAIVGAGAVGAFIGAHLATAGEDVALIARGAHLHALQQRGICIRSNDQEIVAHPFATADCSAVGTVDVVLLTLKAQALPNVAPALQSLFGPDTAVVAAQNGLPWWYFHRHGGPMEGLRLSCIDPEGVLARCIPIERVIGCVIYCSTVLAEPGVVRHIEGNRFSIGEPDGTRSARCEHIAHSFQNAGLKCPIRSRIRHEIWIKLIGNMALNPLSALTRATLADILHYPATRILVQSLMKEGEAVARGLGLELDIDIDQRIEGAARVGQHKTSMLQDLEAGKPLELDAIVGAVIELAERLELELPYTKTIYGCTKLLERTLVTATNVPSTTGSSGAA